LYGNMLEYKQYGSGKINDTFLVKYNQSGIEAKYILRKINKFVFKNPQYVVANSINAVDHIREKLLAENDSDLSRKVMTFIKTCTGEYYYKDDESNYWCMTLFISSAYTIDYVQTEKQAYEAAKAYGRFQKYLLDDNIQKYKYTIEEFHNLAKRLSVFNSAVTLDLAGRASKIENEISQIEEHTKINNKFIELLNSGKLPVRIIHNDTKINNVMLDEETNSGLCVIDLDTVMPGTVLFDYGDMMRTFISPVSEDEKDFTKIEIRKDIFKAMAQGYFSGLDNLLTEYERTNLLLGGMIIIYEQAVRFLTDYLMGDKYYHVEYEDQNYVRACNQLKLLNEVEKNYNELKEIVEDISS